MAVVSIASAKGGCGKTTTAILLGAELALKHGYKVALLDSDVNQHATAFGKKATIRDLTIIPAIDEQNVLSALRDAEEKNDIVLVDLPGGSSTLALKAMQRSHFVLVPTQMSLLDARDAMKTITQIDDAQELIRLPIARAILWTRVLPTFESRAARRVRTDLEKIQKNKGNMSIMKTALMERTAFREMLLTNKVPRQEPTSSQQDSASAKATGNVEAIADEVLEHLKRIAPKKIAEPA
jgi:chromosome partitioning protein